MFSLLQSPGAGLVAAVMIAIVPGYISRSVAGSYDNEGKDAAHTFVHPVGKYTENRYILGRILEDSLINIK